MGHKLRRTYISLCSRKCTILGKNRRRARAWTNMGGQTGKMTRISLRRASVVTQEHFQNQTKCGSSRTKPVQAPRPAPKIWYILQHHHQQHQHQQHQHQHQQQTTTDAEKRQEGGTQTRLRVTTERRWKYNPSKTASACLLHLRVWGHRTKTWRKIRFTAVKRLRFAVHKWPLYGVGMCRPDIPALQRKPALLRVPSLLVVAICANAFTRIIAGNRNGLYEGSPGVFLTIWTMGRNWMLATKSAMLSSPIAKAKSPMPNILLILSKQIGDKKNREG